MLIDTENKFLLGNDYITETYNDIMFAYRGLLYIPGKKAGSESIKELADIYLKTKKIPFKKLRGGFSCVIKENNKIISFTDNSNMHCLFYFQSTISSNYFELLDYLYKEKKTKLLFNNIAISEYLSLGRILFDKSFVSGVQISSSEKYFIFYNNELNILDKGIGTIADYDGTFEPQKFFKNLNYAIDGIKVCQALTGGYDSRLVFIELNNYMKTHPYVCANSDNDKDAIIACKVAATAKVDIKKIHIPKPKITNDFIKEQIESEQIIPYTLSGNYVMQYLKKLMHNDGFNLFLTGDGGVLHKDWEWTQDLPFYHKKKTNLNRFYHQRIAYFLQKDCLDSELEKLVVLQEERVVNEMEKYKKESNTKSYDNLYYNITGNRNLYYSNQIYEMFMYAPLNELEFIQYSYALPRRKRFYYNSIRQMATQTNKVLSRIPTNYGTTSSSETIYILRDILFQGIEYFKKACRLLGRKFFGQSPFTSNIEDWSFNEIKELSISKEALEYAKQNGIIKKAINMDEVNIDLLLRLIHIYYLGTKFDIKLIL